MASLRVRRTSAVALPAGAAPLPLSAFDAIFVSLRPLLHVYLFPWSPSFNTPFPTLAGSLKSSLAQTLASFHPFAGELTYMPSSHSVAIVYPEKPSVLFIEAETDLGITGLLEAEELDSKALQLLAPDILRDVLPAPVMAVQVTQVAGGVAVGVALHHTVADGSGMFHFMNAWAAAAAGSCGSHGTIPLPLHDRNLIVRLEDEEEYYKAALRVYGPNLPSTIPPKQTLQQPCPVVRQTFVFTAEALSHMKRRHVAHANTGEKMAPSTFAAIAAHGWVSFSRAGGFRADDDRPVFVGFFADCRALMSLPADHAYVGNYVSFYKVGLTVSELTAPDGPARALSAIMEAVKKAKANPLENKDEVVADNPWDRIFLVSGSPRFPAYELDLGFGRPARVERACLGGKSEAYLTAGKEPGSVQAMVAMAAEKMTAFRQAFVVDGVQSRP